MVGPAGAAPSTAETSLDALQVGAREGTNGASAREIAESHTDENQVPDIVRTVCRFAAARRNPVAVYVLGEGSAVEGTADTPITKRTVIQLAAALDETLRFDKLDLLIQSSGGDIHAAYQMMSLLRSRMADKGKLKGQLVACVPRRAQSSATLLCLGCDHIALGELGTLGPLDAQIRVGLTDVGTPDYASALHLLRGLTRLQEFSLETLERAAAMLYDKQVRRNDDILKYGIEFSRGITAPLFERIESHRIGYWDQMLKTGEAYGRRLLKNGSLIAARPDEDRDQCVDKVIRRLVNDYPSHEYVIDVRELEDLRLNASVFDGPDRAAARELARPSSDTLIMVVYPPGSPTPDGMDGAETTKLRQWNTFGPHSTGHNVSWTDPESHERFVMRVGQYSKPIKSSRNPWRELQMTGDGPATQYSTGDDLPW